MRARLAAFLAVALVVVPAIPGRAQTIPGLGSLADHAAGSGGGGGTVLIAHAWAGSANGGVSATTQPLDCTGANFIAALVTTYNSAANGSGVYDSTGRNVWGGANRSPNYGSSSGNAALYWIFSPHVSSAMTFTSVNSYPAIFVACFNIGTSLDRSSAGSASCYPCQPGSITPSMAGELFLTGGTSGAFSGRPYSISAPYRMIDQSAGTPGQNVAGAFAYYVNPGTSAQNPTWSSVAGDKNQLTFQVAFHP